MSNKYEILKEYFGYETFKDGQEQIIDSILSGRDAVGIMPTGAGKSICYQLPALIFNGITIVISPLISLMKDQVTALNHIGIRAAYINSSLSFNQQKKALSMAERGEYKIIYVAPERLVTEHFLSFAKSADISFISVDEAHCVSQWGQDFRPAYLNIAEFIKKLPKKPVVAAFTATATRQVKEDIISFLELSSPMEITTGFDRKNLFFEVRRPENKFNAVQKILADCENQSGIIYCSTRKNVEKIYHALNDSGIPTAKYHAGMSDTDRAKSQEDFIYDRVRIIVATNAFGMGIDKSNVSFVIHYNMPKDMESYYQEAGRAGRDGDPARCVLLFSESDINMAKFFIENGGNDELDDETAEAVKANDYRRLNAMVRYCRTSECLRQYILNYFGEKTKGICHNCSNCSADFEQIDITVDAQKILSCIYRMGQNYGIGKITAVLKGKSDIYTDISTFGIMADTKISKINEIFNFLLGENYIRQTNDMKPVIKLNSSAGDILFNGKRLQMKIRKSVLKGVAHKGGEHNKLFENLKALRKKIAYVQSVPAYIIFTDNELEQMCQILPINKQEFMSISGVGIKKCEKYGERFMKEIKKYLSEKENSTEKDAN